MSLTREEKLLACAGEMVMRGDMPAWSNGTVH